MLWAKGDFVRLKKHAGESNVSVEHLRSIYRALAGAAVGRWSVLDRGAFGDYDEYGGGGSGDTAAARVVIRWSPSGCWSRRPWSGATPTRRPRTWSAGPSGRP
jgi:hypothetical protein